LVLNIGTLNTRIVESMVSAGQSANAAGIPVILDPVGAGASELRNGAVSRILAEVRVGVIRGNVSEAGFILGLEMSARGVDASDGDLSSDPVAIASELAKKLNCVVAVTGETDAVSDGIGAVKIKNGHKAMSGITGTGCMCSSLVGAFCGASPAAPFEAAVSAVAVMGIAGEIAFERAGALGGGSFHVALIDAVSAMNESIFVKRAKLYEA
jgi:hydroxyethylthiazole kinase